MSWIVYRKEYLPCPDEDLSYSCNVIHVKETEDEFDTWEEANSFCMGKMHDHLIEIEIREKK